MTKFQVTTFGKWEKYRQQLVHDLLADDKLKEKISRKSLEKALFEDVISDMLTIAFDYSGQHHGTGMAMRDVSINASKQSLTVVLNSLAKALNVEEHLLEGPVSTFRRLAEVEIYASIDHMLTIGKISVQSKSDAIDKLYGEDFKTLYPDLVAKLHLQDQDLIAPAVEIINQKTAGMDFGDAEEAVREHLVYMNQIAPKITATDEFKKLFEARTGFTMDAYKAQYLAKNTSSLQSISLFKAAEKSEPEMKAASPTKGRQLQS